MNNNIPYFHPILQKWFGHQFKTPSLAQERGWPSISKGTHSLILAPTGSGKTLAAFLWCIDSIFRKGLTTQPDVFKANTNGVHTLYVSPLKALNNDIERNLQIPIQGILDFSSKEGLDAPNIRIAVRTGDTPSHARQLMVKNPPHILITTPDSLYLLITSVKGRKIFQNLKYIIVDEIHSLAANKRGVHLSLTLERLMSLCKHEPSRIGLSATQRPLERIAALLGGYKQNNIFEYHPRPVNIIDCGEKKNLDLKIIAPVRDYSDLPTATVWPHVIDKIYHLIQHHKNTLIFVNMRAQAEKIAHQLNDRHNQKSKDKTNIALAHHGSLSKETRYQVEPKLKMGKIPAVVATGSLELGIDIGTIELVIQLEAPKSITNGLQRMGRSGHILHGSSKGRIIPLYPADLLQIVRGYSDFPIILETYRECLYDIFDLRKLKSIIENIHKKNFRYHIVEISSPSPMASGLMFRLNRELILWPSVLTN